jgi:hypothetical protein
MTLVWLGSIRRCRWIPLDRDRRENQASGRLERHSGSHEELFSRCGNAASHKRTGILDYGNALEVGADINLLSINDCSQAVAGTP